MREVYGDEATAVCRASLLFLENIVFLAFNLGRVKMFPGVLKVLPVIYLAIIGQEVAVCSPYRQP